MRATATNLVDEAKRIVDNAERGLETEITRHRRTVAAIVPRPRVSAARASSALGMNPLTASQRAELRAACEEANKAFA
jgi:antitoxin (DNA-binding transcriptional repressor) of toxin-antitoxin stability system